MEDTAKTARSQNMYKARLAEQSERYDEMAEAMKNLVEVSFEPNETELTVEERNLLSVAYKNSVGTRRASWRVISGVEIKEGGRNNEVYKDLASEYRVKVENELNTICEEILTLLTDKLIPKSSDHDSSVFFYKMKGDYYRYISEYSNGEAKEKAAEDARVSYEQATVIAENNLSRTHPIRLGLALNYSVFFFEILNQRDAACEMAKKAFDDAVSEFDHVTDDTYKDSTLIMQLLRDNLTLWTTEIPATTDAAAEGNDQ